MKRLSKEEIIRETVDFYSADTSRRSYVVDEGCTYNSENGTHCAFGRCMLPMYQEQGTNLISNDWPIHIMLENNNITNHDEVLQEQYKGHDLNFWREIQILHDNNKYWGENILTSKGFEAIKQLYQRYK